MTCKCVSVVTDLPLRLKICIATVFLTSLDISEDVKISVFVTEFSIVLPEPTYTLIPWTQRALIKPSEWVEKWQETRLEWWPGTWSWLGMEVMARTLDFILKCKIIGLWGSNKICILKNASSIEKINKRGTARPLKSLLQRFEWQIRRSVRVWWQWKRLDVVRY